MFAHEDKLATQDLDTAEAGRCETFGFRFTALDLVRRQLPRWELLGSVTQSRVSTERKTVAIIQDIAERTEEKREERREKRERGEESRGEI
ncbi:hypothetical protein N7517_009932 [Penicillium concentricum]|uniref:Uncharacterized protein n=1 Tax=Penicillium concentricum TaxID=293559 RepID=A0A9W9RIN2_9EURO|nr:uncharacterized protein N7517_009932 [Penicillium concentricum]KAJ5360741.1 hypothetical protein N7517_009932 [Penicillium concentricum]